MQLKQVAVSEDSLGTGSPLSLRVKANLSCEYLWAPLGAL